MQRTEFASLVLVLSVIFGIQLVECEDIESRIVGGYNVTTLLGFKHMASIRSVADEGYGYGRGHICGGTLISRGAVLTAAHCVYKNGRYLSASNFVIAMGSLDRYVRDNNTLYIRASKLIGHKSFNSNNFDNDIAILILQENVPLNHSAVQPMSLAARPIIIGSSCRIAGWGTLVYKGNYQPNRLQAAYVTINSRSECNRPEHHNGQVLSKMFCAGSFYGPNIQDSCQGDSGGPLECSGILTGVVSNGVECAKVGFPGVYIDVYQYRDWILNNDSSRIDGRSLTVLVALLYLFYFHFNEQTLI